jgi:preprotein translocase subunit SecE
MKAKTEHMSTDRTDQELEPRRGGPLRFWGEVRAEARKVTWATRQEVTVSVIMVLIMAVAAAVFFFLVDTIAGSVIRWILNIG